MDRFPPDSTFEDWVAHVFDHPVEEKAWHWADGADNWEFGFPPALQAEYLRRLWSGAPKTFDGYDDAQVKQGLWYLVHNACSNYVFALTDAQVPVAARCAAIESIFTLYERLFAARCTRTLSHGDEPGVSPLNSICYMWWDVLPIYGGGEYDQRETIYDACLRVMERTLALESPACQEGALHGLGHWCMYAPERVESVIDAYVRRNPSLPRGLAEYAAAARTGCIQ